MEKLEGLDLFELYRNKFMYELSEYDFKNIIKKIFRQGIYALRELEKMGIQHRDIKPDNLFLDF